MRDALIFDIDGQAVIPEVTLALAKHSLPVVLSFDLRAAQAGQSACACHTRSTSQCECTLVVLLVYGAAPEPLTLIVSGCGSQTEVRIAQDADVHPDPRLATDVFDILTEVGYRIHALSAPLETVTGTEPGV